VIITLRREKSEILPPKEEATNYLGKNPIPKRPMEFTTKKYQKTADSTKEKEKNLEAGGVLCRLNKQNSSRGRRGTRQTQHKQNSSRGRRGTGSSRGQRGTGSCTENRLSVPVDPKYYTRIYYCSRRGGPITYQAGALVGLNVKKIPSRCRRARPKSQGLEQP
jgi:hypothetical protein